MSYYYDPKIAHYEGYKEIVKKYSDVLKNNNEHRSSFADVDSSYVCSFDEKGIKKLNKTFKLIRQLEDDTPSKEYVRDKYWNELYRYYNDQTIKYETIPEPLQIGYQEDRVVFSGLERLAQLAVNKTSKTFDHYAIGTGTTKVLPSDVSLEAELARTEIDTTGFAESKGSTLQFVGVFLPSLPSVNVSESGIFDSKFDPSTMFLRTVYTGSNIVPHIANETYIVVSHIIYLISV